MIATETDKSAEYDARLDRYFDDFYRATGQKPFDEWTEEDRRKVCARSEEQIRNHEGVTLEEFDKFMREKYQSVFAV